jgi:hypothetical protein
VVHYCACHTASERRFNYEARHQVWWLSFRQNIAEGTMMGNTCISIASGHHARLMSRTSIRAYLTGGVAVASVGILAAGIVKAPPDLSGARTEISAVQVAALTLPSTSPSTAILEKFVKNQAQTSPLVRWVVQGGGSADVDTLVATAPLALVRVGQPTGSPTQATRTTAESTIDPAIEGQLVNASASAVSPDLLLGNILAIIANPFILVVAPFAFAFIALIVLAAFIQSTTANNAAFATAAPLASDPLVSDSERVTTASDASADAELATVTGKADVSPQVTSNEPATEPKQMSTDTTTSTTVVTDAAKVDEASAEPEVGSVPESPDSDDASGPTNTAERAETPRPVVRDSFDASEQLPDRPDRGDAGGSTTESTVAGDEAATVESSSDTTSSADSSSTGSSSSEDDSSSGDTHGSE